MKQPTIYEAMSYLYGYEELTGKPVRLEYLPTARSRKWYCSSLFIRSYSGTAYEHAMNLLRQGDFYAFRFVVD